MKEMYKFSELTLSSERTVQYLQYKQVNRALVQFLSKLSNVIRTGKSHDKQDHVHDDAY